MGEELLLTLKEWMALWGIDDAYIKNMKDTYLRKVKPELEAQLAKAKPIIEKQERERLVNIMEMNQRVTSEPGIMIYFNMSQWKALREE